LIAYGFCFSTGIFEMMCSRKKVAFFLPVMLSALFTPCTMLAAGEPVVRSIGSLPPGKSVTLSFDITVNDPFHGVTPAISNQAVISGSNFSSVISDDPDAPGTNNPTVTRVYFLPTAVITSPAALVTYDFPSYSVSGSNNIAVAGMLSWSNSLNASRGVVGPFTPGSFAAWSITVIPLDVGVNIITVSASNLWNDIATASVVISRGGVGTGTPAISITSDVVSVAYTISSVTLAGTNSMHVAGPINWLHTEAAASGTVSRASGSNAWSAALALLEGDNTVTVRGTNSLGLIAQDSLVINRQTFAEAAPQIATNALVFPVQGSVLTAYELTNITWLVEAITDDIDGSNLTITLISVHVSNTLAEVSRVTNSIANPLGSVFWPVPDLILPESTFVIRFEVVDSSSLTNSRIFYNNSFTVVPEPGTAVVTCLFIGFLAFVHCKRQ
jgi:hypothetical protein